MSSLRQTSVWLAALTGAAALTSAAAAEDVVVTVTMEQRAANFDKSDANKDGVLDRKEFATTPRAQPPADADQVFALSDLNKDGKVSKAEFMDPNFGTQQAAAPAKP